MSKRDLIEEELDSISASSPKRSLLASQNCLPAPVPQPYVFPLQPFYNKACTSCDIFVHAQKSPVLAPIFIENCLMLTSCLFYYASKIYSALIFRYPKQLFFFLFTSCVSRIFETTASHATLDTSSVMQLLGLNFL